MRKLVLVSVAICILLLLAACATKPTCPPRAEAERFLIPLELETLSVPAAEDQAGPVEVEINGRMTPVDKVVTGPLCNDHWDGTVYVACNVRVLKWEEDPLFLKGCDLLIEPGTVVYVAYHNDAPYYNGCSCHTGEAP